MGPTLEASLGGMNPGQATKPGSFSKTTGPVSPLKPARAWPDRSTRPHHFKLPHDRLLANPARRITASRPNGCFAHAQCFKSPITARPSQRPNPFSRTRALAVRLMGVKPKGRKSQENNSKKQEAKVQTFTQLIQHKFKQAKGQNLLHKIYHQWVHGPAT